jgi:sortase A
MTRMRRILRGVSTVLIAAGVLMLVDAALTIAWQEPVTALLTKLRQGRLDDDLAKLERAGPTPVEQRALDHLRTDRQRVAFLARSLRRRLKDGEAAGRIRIRKIGADYVIVKGTDPGALHRGPGIYDHTPFPGARGTTGIAGHRTTYLAPFRNIDDLRPGDDIEVDMPYATFHYRVQRSQIVTPDSLWIVRRQPYDRLVLSACHPLYSAAKRIVVFARLASVQQRSNSSSAEPRRSDI